MNEFPEALRLADWLQSCAESVEHINAAAELRRLHALSAAAPAVVPAVTEADIQAAREHIADVHNVEQLRSALGQLRREVVIEMAARGLVPDCYGAAPSAPQPAASLAVDWARETDDPVAEMDAIMAVYRDCMGITPGPVMEQVVQKTKHMLLGWWGHHREAIRAALVAAAPQQGETAGAVVDHWMGEYDVVLKTRAYQALIELVGAARAGAQAIQPAAVTPRYSEWMHLREKGCWTAGVPDWAKDHAGHMNDTVVKNAVIDELAAALAAAPHAGAQAVPTDAEIDALLDSPATLVWHAADDTRTRMRIWTRLVLARWVSASPTAVQAAASAEHIKEPYTLAEIKAKIESGDYSAELMLQHAMLLLEASPAAVQAGAIQWTPGPNVFKDWCSRWFGPDADDDYLAKAVYSLPPTAQRFAEPASGGEAQAEVDARDAARYRWLRQHRSIELHANPSVPWVVRCEFQPIPVTVPIQGPELDAAIDAASSKEGGAA